MSSRAPAGRLGPPIPGIPGERRTHLFGRDLRVVVPSRHDPRLKLTAIILVLQVLGQTVLGFKVSIAQIVVTLGVCLLIELGVFIFRDNLLTWPGSAIQTGNSIALLLRASGTQHGDWWSLHGIQYFLLAAVIGLGSKYLVRPGGRHVFNPSNVGIVWVLLVIGPRFVFPQYLWWGPLNVPVALALVVIAIGAAWILRPPVGMIPMAIAFLVPFNLLVGLFALTGHSFIAAWHHGPVSGLEYWLDICFSPEVFVFMFFMMSDPRTAPRPARLRLIYGAAVAVCAAALLFPQPTEFGIKLGILAALTLVCATVPVIESLASGRHRPLLHRSLRVTPALVATAIIAVAAPLDSLTLVGDRQVVQVEEGIINPQ